MSHCPNHFHLLPNMKQKMRGQRFSTPQEGIETFENHASEIQSSEWKKCFDNWFVRMQKCIDHKGEYYEKQTRLFSKMLCSSQIL